jgi:uncharacterized membrane protein
MQSINVVAINRVVLGMFYGSAAGCALLALAALSTWNEPAAVWRLIGGLLYLVSTIGVTMVCNIRETTRSRPWIQPVSKVLSFGITTSTPR